jgi:hypothetical protein
MSGILNVIAGDNAPAAGGNSAAYTNFIARTSGLNSTHLNAYAALLNGLTTDGIFNSDGTSTYLDALYMFATADATTALLSLVSATYNATAVSSPSFTADAGYTFTAAGSRIDSNFSPGTSGSPKFVRNSASIFLWSNTSTQISQGAGGTVGDDISLYPRASIDIFYCNINDTSYDSAANTDAKGFYLGSRTASNVKKGYKNGTQVISTSTASAAVSVQNIKFPNLATQWSGIELAAGFGAGLDATQQSNLYARIHTYLQTIAGIA